MRFKSDRQRKAVMARINKNWVRRASPYINEGEVEYINKENEATVHIFKDKDHPDRKWVVSDENVTGVPKGYSFKRKEDAMKQLRKVMRENPKG